MTCSRSRSAHSALVPCALTGCADAVLEGGMPNDKGAWMLGRAGWCNGRDVKPWVRRRACTRCSQDCLSSPLV